VFERRARGRKDGKNQSLGQVVVEMALVLPVFFAIVFTIMEIGNLAFWMIVLNHAAYEAARAGALLAGPDPGTNSGGVNISRAKQKAQEILQRIITTATCEVASESTFPDRQAGGVMNQDLIVKAHFDVHLAFPISSIMLSNPKGSGKYGLDVAVRMPIEQPLRQ
jgi:hypothetical protein